MDTHFYALDYDILLSYVLLQKKKNDLTAFILNVPALVLEHLLRCLHVPWTNFHHDISINILPIS